MTSRITTVYSIEGKELKKIEVPTFFLEKVREDIVNKVLEAKKSKQPYAPSPVAGKQQSASGVIRHKRHSWKSSRGRGKNRVPRKIMWRRGTQFNWVGAEVASTRGGRRAHPPKVIGMINTKKINKKEEKIAFLSALSATADSKLIKKKYETLSEVKIKDLPLVVDNKVSELKTKVRNESFKKILGELYSASEKKKQIRAGKGKLRGRKHKTSAGMLFVVGNNEKKSIAGFDTKRVEELGVTDLAKGGVGRIVIYTENAIKDLEQKIKGNNKKSKETIK